MIFRLVLSIVFAVYICSLSVVSESDPDTVVTADGDEDDANIGLQVGIVITQT